MRVALLHNPNAGNGDRTGRELLNLMKREGFSASRKDLVEIGRELHGKPRKVSFDLVAVAGGDGSVKRAACALACTGMPLAIIPLGTANNIATCLGVQGDPAKIIHGWKRDRVRAIDLGRAIGPWGERFFIESAGVGLIARMIAVMNRIGRVAKHEFGDRQDQVLSDRRGLAVLAHDFPGVHLRVKEPEKRMRRERFLICETLNLPRTGPGIFLADGSPRDGRLDLVAAGTSKRSELIVTLLRSMASEHPRALLRAKKVSSIELELGPFELRVDDEIVWPPEKRSRRRPTGVARARLESVPEALLCLLPRAHP